MEYAGSLGCRPAYRNLLPPAPFRAGRMPTERLETLPGPSKETPETQNKTDLRLETLSRLFRTLFGPRGRKLSGLYRAIGTCECDCDRFRSRFYRAIAVFSWGDPQSLTKGDFSAISRLETLRLQSCCEKTKK